MAINRRKLLFFVAATTGAVVVGSLPKIATAQSLAEPFELPPLPYDYNALEPYIDAETMRFHHDKHHAAYTSSLNEAINKYPELKSQIKSAEDLLRDLNSLPEDIKLTVRNNGGGYVNHKMFWEIMSPDGGGKPTGKIATAISENFGSFEDFQEEFNKAGKTRFGSGWVWLVYNKSDGNLLVMSTPNQDSPIMEGLYPIMGNDVWEHAYYLNYKNNRGEYLAQWWNVVNWDEVNRRFEAAIA